jgi:heat shock protein HtpX
MNRIKTVVLLGLLTGLLLAIGGALGGQQGMFIALILAAVMNFSAYWYSDKLVLRHYRARLVDPSQAPGIHEMVRELAQTSGLPMPQVYVIDDPTPNAFATGRDPGHAVVAVTTGIVRILNARELKGVLAHELSHIKNRDILVGSVAATIAGAVMFLANMAQWSMLFGGGQSDDDEGGLGMLGLLATAILAPIGAMLIQMAISRSREYLADRDGAAMAHDPEGLASALNKLEQANHRQHMTRATPQTAHMFTVNPLSGGRFAGLFSTHPPITERVARLRGMPGGRPERSAPSRDYRFDPAVRKDVDRQPGIPHSKPPAGKIDWS